MIFRHFIVFLFVAAAGCISGQSCGSIDFDSIPGESPYEGMVIDSQLHALYGISFHLEGGGHPRIAEDGSPATGFKSSFGNDRARADQGIGAFFLTDDGELSGLSAPPVIIYSDYPIQYFEGRILDVDHDEIFIIEARNQSGATVSRDTVHFGDPGTGDGLAAMWTVQDSTCTGIYSIRLQGKRTVSGVFGLGLDLFSFCYFEQSPEESAEIFVEEPSCDMASGQLTISTVGSGNYQFSLDEGPFQMDSTFSGLVAGEHIIEVLRADGCSFLDTVSLEEDNPTIELITAIPADCENANGQLTLNASGGEQPYLFSLDGVNFQANPTFNGLPPGSYTGYILDDSGCIDSLNVEIEDTPPPQIEDVEIIDASCSAENGQIIIEATSNSSLEYSVSGQNFQQSNQFTGLPPGTYQVIVRDTGACTDTLDIPVNIEESNELGSVSLDISHADCKRQEGTVKVLPSDNFPLFYSINGQDYQDENIFTGLPPGDYSLFIRNDGNCRDTLEFTIEDIPPPVIDSIVTEPGYCIEDASRALIFASGAGTLQYALNGGPFSADSVFQNLEEKSHLVIVEDENGCRDSADFSIVLPDLPEITLVSLQNTSCGKPNGMAQIKGIGESELEYSLDGNGFQSDTDFSRLSPGIHQIIARDEYGCRDSITFPIEESDSPRFLEVNVDYGNCSQQEVYLELIASGGIGPLEYSLDGSAFQEENLYTVNVEGNYILFVRDSMGCTDTAEAVIDFPGQPSILSVDVRHIDCQNTSGAITIYAESSNKLYYALDGGNFQDTNQFTDLSPGRYTLLVMTDEGCIDTAYATVTETESPVILNIVTTQADCDSASGTAMIEITGGTGIIEYSIDGNKYQESAIFEQLSPGTYNLWVRDSLHCKDEEPFSIVAPDPYDWSGFNTQDADCGLDNGLLELLNVSSENNTVLINGDLLDMPGSNILGPGDYALTVIDSNGCRADTTFAIGQHPCQYYIPNAITPNGDGINDMFQVYFSPNFSGRVLNMMIFNRWGDKLFEAASPEQASRGWNGRAGGQKVNPGVFVYLIEIEIVDGQKILEKGDLTVID